MTPFARAWTLAVVKTVPVSSKKVIVRSAVGSVTVRVVSKSFAVAPSRTMDAPDTLTNGVVREVTINIEDKDIFSSRQLDIKTLEKILLNKNLPQKDKEHYEKELKGWKGE